jgi:hypothetical protein
MWGSMAVLGRGGGARLVFWDTTDELGLCLSLGTAVREVGTSGGLVGVAGFTATGAIFVGLGVAASGVLAAELPVRADFSADVDCA